MPAGGGPASYRQSWWRERHAPGLATCQPRATASAKIGFPPLTYDANGDSATTWLLGSQALLRFTTATSGSVSFLPPASAPPPPEGVLTGAFCDDTQDYVLATRILKLTFAVQFPDCTAPIRAVDRD